MNKNKRILVIIGVSLIVSFLSLRVYKAEKSRLANRKEYGRASTPNEEIENIERYKTSPAKSSELSYSVIDKSSLYDVKCSFNIRLSRKATEQELWDIAYRLKDDLEKEYERIFIVYYLPEMVVGNGGWATSHFEGSTLEIRILGITQRREEAIIENIEIGPDVNVIGNWVDEGGYPCVLTIYEKRGKTYIKTIYEDGSNDSKELTKKDINGRIIYVESRHNIFFSIDTKGNLGCYDNQGLIYTAYRR